jgi:hypothetical protein
LRRWRRLVLFGFISFSLLFHVSKCSRQRNIYECQCHQRWNHGTGSHSSDSETGDPVTRLIQWPIWDPDTAWLSEKKKDYITGGGIFSDPATANHVHSWLRCKNMFYMWIIYLPGVRGL